MTLGIMTRGIMTIGIINVIQNYSTLHNDTRYNVTGHDVTWHNDTWHCVTQHDGSDISSLCESKFNAFYFRSKCMLNNHNYWFCNTAMVVNNHDNVISHVRVSK
jgi:hypothetical protein